MTETTDQASCQHEFKFRPTDSEVIYLLKGKVFNHQHVSDSIYSRVHRDPYSDSPEELPRAVNALYPKNKWWFYAERPSCDMHFDKLMTDQDDGYYSSSSGDFVIVDEETESNVVGFIRRYDFFRGIPAKKTPWVVKEYRLNPNAFSLSKYDDLTKHRISTYAACKLIWKGN